MCPVRILGLSCDFVITFHYIRVIYNVEWTMYRTMLNYHYSLHGVAYTPFAVTKSTKNVIAFVCTTTFDFPCVLHLFVSK